MFIGRTRDAILIETETATALFRSILDETVSGPKVEVAEESENESRLMNLESKSIVGPLRGGGGGSSSKAVFSNHRLLQTCRDLLLGLCHSIVETNIIVSWASRPIFACIYSGF